QPHTLAERLDLLGVERAANGGRAARSAQLAFEARGAQFEWRLAGAGGGALCRCDDAGRADQLALLIQFAVDIDCEKWGFSAGGERAQARAGGLNFGAMPDPPRQRPRCGQQVEACARVESPLGRIPACLALK